MGRPGAAKKGGGGSATLLRYNSQKDYKSLQLTSVPGPGVVVSPVQAPTTVDYHSKDSVHHTP